MFGRVAAAVLIPILLIIASIVVIAFARGWRFNPTARELVPTGILVATSEPDGAQVFLNGKFSGATNSDINLSPEWYDIMISKEGYHEWKRKMRIQGEIVVKTDAVLFLKNPGLAPLTATGVSNPILSPDGTKIAYIASPSAVINTGQSVFEEELTKPTLFIYDFSFRNLPFSKNPRPYEGTIVELLQEWKTEANIAEAVNLRNMPDEFITVATDSVKLLSFSPDGTKVLYEATAAATLARAINPPLIGTRELEEDRAITANNIYVYDATEDRNYRLTDHIGKLLATFHTALTPTKAAPKKPTPTPTPLKNAKLDEYAQLRPPVFWLGTSRHLVLIENGSISVIEYDGSNKVSLYSGPFENGYVFPHPSGRQLIIMTTFNPQYSVTPSLYTLSIR